MYWMISTATLGCIRFGRGEAVLDAQTLLHSKKATRAIIQSPPVKYEYMVSIEDNKSV